MAIRQPNLNRRPGPLPSGVHKTSDDALERSLVPSEILDLHLFQSGADTLPQPAHRALGAVELLADLAGAGTLQAQLDDRALVLIQSVEQSLQRLTKKRSAEHGSRVQFPLLAMQ